MMIDAKIFTEGVDDDNNDNDFDDADDDAAAAVDDDDDDDDDDKSEYSTEGKKMAPESELDRSKKQYSNSTSYQ